METETELEDIQITEWHRYLEDIHDENDSVVSNPPWLDDIEHIDLLGNYSEQTGAIFG